MRKLLLSLLMLPALAWAAQPISAEALLAKAQPPLVLDVRSPEEFMAGHVPGAINIPHTDIPKHLKSLAAARHQELVVYCRSGRRAQLAITALEADGFDQVKHLQGDWLGWQEAKLPVETGEEQP
ncbi:rhodanese-like domain-containing protein [Gallaecimonas xiamenensis]|uniref:Phage shock protein E n=1 Tax=Gallaecimonas xiamenensis 3-C-1 TaxID=745411 RepID=K2IHN8_9GAMM|nr:rhodanese-like domain-containing protein [Gallaecimonas xiamenensis]EKE69616.1 phage shock protein E [Gallaecimonas xiamenensis 3-C-1]